MRKKRREKKKDFLRFFFVIILKYIIKHLYIKLEQIISLPLSLSYFLDYDIIMARWISFCFILFLFLFSNISMMMLLPDQRILFKRHIGSARDKLFRAKQHPINHENLFQRPQQILPSPDVLRARWIELFNEQNKINEPLITED